MGGATTWSSIYYIKTSTLRTGSRRGRGASRPTDGRSTLQTCPSKTSDTGGTPLGGPSCFAFGSVENHNFQMFIRRRGITNTLTTSVKFFFLLDLAFRYVLTFKWSVECKHLPAGSSPHLAALGANALALPRWPLGGAKLRAGKHTRRREMNFIHQRSNQENSIRFYTDTEL